MAGTVLSVWDTSLNQTKILTFQVGGATETTIISNLLESTTFYGKTVEMGEEEGEEGEGGMGKD